MSAATGISFVANVNIYLQSIIGKTLLREVLVVENFIIVFGVFSRSLNTFSVPSKVGNLSPFLIFAAMFYSNRAIFGEILRAIQYLSVSLEMVSAVAGRMKYVGIPFAEE